MLKKALLICLFVQAAVSALAQKTVSVEVPQGGDFAIFASHGLPTEAPAKPTTSQGGKVDVTPNAADDHVSVWDRKTGNLATTPISKVTGEWAPKPQDFNLIAAVEIDARHDGQPIAAGQVELNDGHDHPTQIIDSQSQGAANFFAVNPGRLIVTVRYRKSGGGSDSITEIFQAPMQRNDLVPMFEMAIGEVVDTVTATKPASPAGTTAPASQGPAAPGTPSSSQPSANPVGTAVGYLLAIAIAVGIGYGIMRYMKNNAGTVSEKLEQLGVQVPKPGDQGAAAVTPAVPDPTPPPQPIQKIILDDAAPIPVPAAPTISTTVLHEPSLVTDSGVAIPLIEGETVVGREAGLGLSLTAETSVSRRHAQLVRKGSEVILTDLGSTNGTFVNGAQIQSPAVLRPGDSVQFGSSKFRYQG
ncbi:MAG TPA: FHA domain-containing protein [Fimbriimonas sp.]|nr:FHA domain-containing protein [Fimbriimonas sp.]